MTTLEKNVVMLCLNTIKDYNKTCAYVAALGAFRKLETDKLTTDKVLAHISEETTKENEKLKTVQEWLQALLAE